MTTRPEQKYWFTEFGTPTSKVKVWMVPPHTLRVNPLSEKIYGCAKPDAKFIQSIKDDGILEPLVVVQSRISDGMAYPHYELLVVSGHRRLAAALELGMLTVPVRQANFNYDAELDKWLIKFNHQRVKTAEQKAREFKELKRIEAALAKEKETQRKKAASQTTPLKSTKSKPHDSRKTAAAAVGLKPDTARKLEKLVDAADEGNATARAQLDKLNKGETSVSAAVREIAKTTPPELVDAVETPYVPPPTKPTESRAGQPSVTKTLENELQEIVRHNPAIGKVRLIPSMGTSGVDTAMGRYDLMLYGISKKVVERIREVLRGS